MAAHGHPLPSNAWARARLTRGSSGGQIWEITGDYPEARLSLGSATTAGWPVQAPGVAPLHCELFWDGQSLWVADTQQVGNVFLDGGRVTDWVQIEGPAELRFGAAAMDIETSTPLAQQMASRPSQARPVTVTDMVAPPDERSSTPRFGGAAGDQSVPDLENEATRLASSPMDAERTQIASPKTPDPDLRPRLGGGGGPGHSAETTRMVSMPGSMPDSMPGASGQPPMGYGSPAPVVAPPPASPGMPSLGNVAPPMGSPPPAYAGPPSGGSGGHAGPPGYAGPPGGGYGGPPSQGWGPPGAPPPAGPPPSHGQASPHAAPPPGAPGWGAPNAPDPGSPFVAPPQTAADAQAKESVLDKVVAVLKPEDSKAKTEGKQAMPTRTWILLAVTIVVTVGWLLWDEAPAEQAAAPPSTSQATTPPAPSGAEGPAEEAPAPTEAAEGTETQTDTPAESPSPTATAGSEGDDEGEEGTEEEGPSLQRRAADAFIAGRYPDALAMYRQLAQRRPSEGAYTGMVTILERRIRERCTDGTGPGGEPCDTP